MITDINYFNKLWREIYKNRSVFFVNSETVNFKLLRLKQFHFEARVFWIFLKQSDLFAKLFHKLMLFQIHRDVAVNRSDNHAIFV